MKNIQIKEHLDSKDFLEASFPEVAKPIYKKRLFIINMAFGLLFIVASIYLFYETYKTGIKFGNMHYFYLFFTILFPFLAYYLVRKEKNFYKKLVDQINDLNTIYTFTDNQITIKNKAQNLVYKVNQIKNIDNRPKWLVFEFKNNERLAIYKPNIAPADLKQLQQTFGLD